MKLGRRRFLKLGLSGTGARKYLEKLLQTGFLSGKYDSETHLTTIEKIIYKNFLKLMV